MVDVNVLIDRVFDREGRYYTNHPNDNGGPTKYGITIHDLREDRGRATAADVRALTEDQARGLYTRKYWTRPGYDKLPELIQESMFDTGILHGTFKATRLLQEIINEAGFGPVDLDGKLGPQSFRCAVEACRAMGEYLVNAIVEERAQHFQNIVARNSSQNVFFKGWMNRINPFRKRIDATEYA